MSDLLERITDHVDEFRLLCLKFDTTCALCGRELLRRRQYKSGLGCDIGWGVRLNPGWLFICGPCWRDRVSDG